MEGLLFEVDISTSAAAGADPVAAARAAEALGFDFVSANDHPAAHDPRDETWTMLAWIAPATSRIRVATRVLGSPTATRRWWPRWPRPSTGSRVGGSSLGWGLAPRTRSSAPSGSGSAPRGTRSTGSRRPSASSAASGPSQAFSFAGRHYRTEGAELAPRPDHPIPLWLGTFGRRGLDITGRLADGWIPSLALALPDQAAVMRDRIVSAARRRPRSPAHHLRLQPGGPGGERAKPKSGGGRGIPGCGGRATARVRAARLTAMNLHPVGPGTQEQLERLAGEVLPAVRAHV
jgi:Luciferase-like monooxygenase